MKKIVFIGYVPLTTQLYSKFFMGDLTNKGYKIEYWDFSKIYFPSLSVAFEDFHVKNIDIYQYLSFKLFEQELRKVDREDALFISMITYEWRVIKIFRLLTKYQCKTCFFAQGALPTPKLSNARKLASRLVNFQWATLIQALKNRFSLILKKYHFIKVYDFVFVAGAHGIATIGFGFNIDQCLSKLININYVDYDISNSIQDQTHMFEFPYAVFADEYIPFHPDNVICGIKPPPAIVYYQELNSFFDKIERQYNLKIIIAAHPKALKYREQNFFNGREVIFDKTHELIKDCKFMMTHYSTCMGIAVYYNIPMVFLSSELFKRYEAPHIFNYIKFLVGYFDADYISYDTYEEEILKTTVEKSKYQCYKYDYMTSPESENGTTKGIFLKFLEQKF